MSTNLLHLELAFDMQMTIIYLADEVACRKNARSGMPKIRGRHAENVRSAHLNVRSARSRHTIKKAPKSPVFNHEKKTMM